MKNIWLSATILILFACKKPPVPPVSPLPEMEHTDLHDAVVRFGNIRALDLDGDQMNDVSFGTLLVGDPLHQEDKRQWLVTSSFYTNLPVNAVEQIPVMQTGDLVPVENFSGYNWYNASSILLAQKRIGHNYVFWDGPWKQASHRFIPVQVMKGNDHFNGWVEISFDTVEEKLVLHRAAISKEPNKRVQAGK